MLTHFTDKACPRGGVDTLPPHVIALIREQRRCWAAVSRYDRYIAQAAGHLTLQSFWRTLKRQEKDDAQRLNNRLDQEIADGE